MGTLVTKCKPKRMSGVLCPVGSEPLFCARRPHGCSMANCHSDDDGAHPPHPRAGVCGRGGGEESSQALGWRVFAGSQVCTPSQPLSWAQRPWLAWLPSVQVYSCVPWQQMHIPPVPSPVSPPPRLFCCVASLMVGGLHTHPEGSTAACTQQLNTWAGLAHSCRCYGESLMIRHCKPNQTQSCCWCQAC